MEKMAKVKVGNAEKAAKVAKVHVIQAWPGLVSTCHVSSRTKTGACVLEVGSSCLEIEPEIISVAV